MSSVNQSFHVTTSDTPDSVEAGEYKASFVGMTGPHDGEHGPYYKLEFNGNNGCTFVGFCDIPKVGPKIGERSNKLGRWLCGLAGAPLNEEVTVNPSEHKGKQYKLLYVPNKNGNVSPNTLSPST